MKEISNKQRLIKLIEIFEQKTDQNYQLSVEDIIVELRNEYGNHYDVAPSTIKDDIKTLFECNYRLIESQDKYGKKFYSRQERKFEIHELRMLVDAVSSARFIPLKDAKKIIENIKTLTSKHLAKKLEHGLFVDEPPISDSQLKYRIDKLHGIIPERKLIRFQYGRYNVHKKFIYSNNHGFHEVAPYGLVWNNGFYYLVASSQAKGQIINYRVDRMRKLEETDKKFELPLTFDLSDHVNQCFNMYAGKVSKIQIRFDNHLINAIIDRFGIKVNVQVDDESHFILTTKAAINTGLIRWVLNWGSDAEVIEPLELREEIKKEIIKMHQIYNS